MSTIIAAVLVQATFCLWASGRGFGKNSDTMHNGEPHPSGDPTPMQIYNAVKCVLLTML